MPPENYPASDFKTTPELCLPPEYSKGKNDKRNASNISHQERPPDLEELERRIEQLAQDLEKAYAHQKCAKCNTPIIEDPPRISSPIPTNRPSPLKDRVSFYACIFPPMLISDFRLVGL
jgi:hypothetical protein